MENEARIFEIIEKKIKKEEKWIVISTVISVILIVTIIVLADTVYKGQNLPVIIWVPAVSISFLLAIVCVALISEIRLQHIESLKIIKGIIKEFPFGERKTIKINMNSLQKNDLEEKLLFSLSKSKELYADVKICKGKDEAEIKVVIESKGHIEVQYIVNVLDYKELIKLKNFLFVNYSKI